MKREDLHIETYDPYAGPPGGMKTGRIPTGVKITHLPTGAVAICTSHRQQHRNRDQAMQELAGKVAVLDAFSKTLDMFPGSGS